MTKYHISWYFAVSSGKEFPMTENEEKWRLNIGCHNGTHISRDIETRTFNTLEDCRKNVAESEAAWKEIRYFVWFAKAMSPHGEEIKLHEGTPYR